MRYRVTMVWLAALLVTLAGCSTGSSAQKDESMATAEGAQTESADEMDEEGDDESDDEDEDEDEAEEAERAESDDEDDEAREKKKKMKEMMAKSCPMDVEGTKAAAKKMDNGVAMEFTTSGDVQEVRKRAARMAEMHNEKREKMMANMDRSAERNKGKWADGKKKGKSKGKRKNKKHKKKAMHSKSGKGHHGMMMSKVTAKNIDGGVQMVHDLSDHPDKIDKMYATMQKRAKMMNEEKSCAMQGMSKGNDWKDGTHGKSKGHKKMHEKGTSGESKEKSGSSAGGGQ